MAELGLDGADSIFDPHAQIPSWESLGEHLHLILFIIFKASYCWPLYWYLGRGQQHPGAGPEKAFPEAVTLSGGRRQGGDLQSELEAFPSSSGISAV